MPTEGTCVLEVNGEIEAQQIKAFLAAHGIPCEFRGEALRTTHGFTLNGLGVVGICVPEALAGEAESLLARAEAGELRLPDQADLEVE